MIKTARELNTSEAVAHDNLKNLDLDENQRLLVEGCRRTIDPTGLVILDGHTVIERVDGYSLVPTTVFAALRIEGIFALVDRPEEIVARRTSDLARKRPQVTISKINERQEIATEHARTIADSLKIPFRLITSADADACHRLLSAAVWDDV